jgi:hypothetical protein
MRPLHVAFKEKTSDVRWVQGDIQFFYLLTDCNKKAGEGERNTGK